VLALQDKLAYGTTFEAALSSLFGGNASSLTVAEAPQTPASPQQGNGAVQPAPDLNGLITEASRDFGDYQRLTSEGKLGEAGQKLEQLKRVLDKLNAYKK